jgi:hypothetical protein
MRRGFALRLVVGFASAAATLAVAAPVSMADPVTEAESSLSSASAVVGQELQATASSGALDTAAPAASEPGSGTASPSTAPRAGGSTVSAPRQLQSMGALQQSMSPSGSQQSGGGMQQSTSSSGSQQSMGGMQQSSSPFGSQQSIGGLQQGSSSPGSGSILSPADGALLPGGLAPAHPLIAIGPLSFGSGDLAPSLIRGGLTSWMDLAGLTIGPSVAWNSLASGAASSPGSSSVSAEGAAPPRRPAPDPDPMPPGGAQAAVAGSAMSLLFSVVALTILLALALAPLGRRLTIRPFVWRPPILAWQLERPG